METSHGAKLRTTILISLTEVLINSWEGLIFSGLPTAYGAKIEILLSSRFTVVEIEHTAKPFAAMNWPIG